MTLYLFNAPSTIASDGKTQKFENLHKYSLLLHIILLATLFTSPPALCKVF